MSNFTTRLVSGTIYVALIVLVLALSIVWGLWVLLSFFAVAGLIEFNQLTRVNRPYIFRIVLDCVAASGFSTPRRSMAWRLVKA